mmetsp:Transcript_25165/g.32830  ORF Transcript_25165/g.32830 Transcript_25165/m.32830 type:complete len:90 (+) Transcript_25165:157-426(+)
MIHLPAAVKSSEKSRSSKKFPVGQKITSENEATIFHGDFGKARRAFISQVTELLDHWQYDQSEYFTMLVSQCKSRAFKTIQRKKDYVWN